MRRDGVFEGLRAEGLDGLLVMGGSFDNADFRYCLPGAGLTGGMVLYLRQGRVVVLHSPMERENLPRGDWYEAVCESELRKDGEEGRKSSPQVPIGLREASQAFRLLRHVGFRGRLGLAGRLSAPVVVELMNAVRSLKGVEIAGVEAHRVLQKARSVKLEDEIKLIGKAARRVDDVMRKVSAFVAEECTVDSSGYVRESGGTHLTCGRIRRLVEEELLLAGMDMPVKLIISHGREAGIPHHPGTPERRIRAGLPVLLDVFPRWRDNGYFCDVTRTFCIGEPVVELKRIYKDVALVRERVIEMIEPGLPVRRLDERACELFEKLGHSTLRTDPAGTSGYCHGLGHGVGLDVHEYPPINFRMPEEVVLEPGMVFTIEPGLYYPARKIGVRLEDTVVLGADGKVRILSRSMRKLVIRPRR